MKRKTKIKFIAVCLIFTFFCNIAVLAVGSSGAGTVGKFSETLSAKLAAATKDEKISAYVFFKDESESVLTTMKNTHAELVVQFQATVSGTYKIKIYRSASASNEISNIGLAVW